MVGLYYVLCISLRHTQQKLLPSFRAVVANIWWLGELFISLTLSLGNNDLLTKQPSYLAESESNGVRRTELKVCARTYATGLKSHFGSTQNGFCDVLPPFSLRAK